eukprot:1235131-Pyramimonas_sp.AAC.1
MARESAYLFVGEAARVLEMQEIRDGIRVEWALIHQIPEVLAEDEVLLEAGLKAELVHEPGGDARALGGEVLREGLHQVLVRAHGSLALGLGGPARAKLD